MTDSVFNERRIFCYYFYTGTVTEKVQYDSGTIQNVSSASNMSFWNSMFNTKCIVIRDKPGRCHFQSVWPRALNYDWTTTSTWIKHVTLETERHFKNKLLNMVLFMMIVFQDNRYLACHSNCLFSTIKWETEKNSKRPTSRAYING